MLILSSTIAHELQDHLALFQFVPYAMSLSVSIAYREMRHNKIPLHRARARIQFQTICDVLSDLAGVFWSASTTADMGKKLLKEMDRVVSAVVATESKKSRRNSAVNNSMNSANANANANNPAPTPAPLNSKFIIPLSTLLYSQIANDFKSSWRAGANDYQRDADHPPSNTGF
jgi:hypothetical protein